MAFLKNLFGKKSQTQAATETRATDCLHVTLIPKWDSVHDMGVEDKATSYVCQICNTSFTPAETRVLRQTESERLRAAEPKVEASE